MLHHGLPGRLLPAGSVRRLNLEPPITYLYQSAPQNIVRRDEPHPAPDTKRDSDARHFDALRRRRAGVVVRQDRSAILIHAGNFLSDTAGCVLVGRAFADLDGDHVTDITDSQATLRELVGQIPRDGCPLQIKTMDVSLHALEPDTH